MIKRIGLKFCGYPEVYDIKGSELKEFIKDLDSSDEEVEDIIYENWLRSEPDPDYGASINRLNDWWKSRPEFVNIFRESGGEKEPENKRIKFNIKEEEYLYVRR